MARQLVDAPLCRGNLNTSCSQIWGPSAVLMGDAAHSMWPTLGQGVNAALEDAAVLNRVLKACRVSLAQGLSMGECYVAVHVLALGAVLLSTGPGVGIWLVCRQAGGADSMACQCGSTVAPSSAVSTRPQLWCTPRQMRLLLTIVTQTHHLITLSRIWHNNLNLPLKV